MVFWCVCGILKWKYVKKWKVYQYNRHKKTLQLVNEKANNFEAYLKNRNSPKEPLSSPKNTGEKREVFSGSSKGS